MSTSEPQPRYLRVGEIAARIHRTERTAWQRIADAGVPRYRTPEGHTVIREDDLPALDAPRLIPRDAA